MTHDDRVLGLLSDGEPHSSGEVYDLRVVAHSRVASLRRKGFRIVCWQDAGVYWYQLEGALTERGVAECPLTTSPDEATSCARRNTDEGRIGLASRPLHAPRSVSTPGVLNEDGRLDASPEVPRDAVLVEHDTGQLAWDVAA